MLPNQSEICSRSVFSRNRHWEIIYLFQFFKILTKMVEEGRSTDMNNLKNLLKALNPLLTKAQDLGLLLSRLTIGVVFVQAGWGKFNNLDRTIGYFDSIGIPMASLQAPFAAGAELICGALVLVGFLTRLAAIPPVIVMIVAILTAHRSEISGLPDLLGLSPFSYLVMYFIHVGFGAGRFSVDRALKLN